MPTYLSPGVYIDELEASSRPIEGVGTAVAAFVGLAARGPFHTPTLVTNWSQFVEKFGDFLDGSFLAHSVYGYFQNGGGACYIVRIGNEASTNGSGPAALGAGASAQLGSYRVRALTAGDTGNQLSVEVKLPDGDAPDADSFTLVVKKGRSTEETWDVSTKRGRANVATIVNEKSSLIKIEETGTGAVDRPQAGTVALAGGTDPLPTSLGPEDYVGDAALRTGFSGLEAVDEVTMVCVPDLMAAYRNGAIDLDGVKTVQLSMIAHCELMGDRIAILDPPPGLSAQQVKEWRVEFAGYDSRYAALYWPNVRVFDPVSATNIFVPPSGHVAGVWGRNDDSRGVHKAPANEVVRGAVDLEVQITKTEHDLLNPLGINCIRRFPGRGLRIYGARTLSSDPAWRYLNVRRLFNYLEESILSGTQWVVFEPNDEALWARVRRTLSAFLLNEWRKGALFGLTPNEAFYVKCDRETNTPESIDLGQVICEVGVAPVKPAEFVIFRLAQLSSGTSQINE